MTIFLIILMFIVSVYAINQIVDKGQIAHIGNTEIKKGVSDIACIAIALIAAAYNAGIIYILLRAI